jgi:hypothetical protein
MKAALYARVSTQDQNCEMQLRKLREYCARRGREVELGGDPIVCDGLADHCTSPIMAVAAGPPTSSLPR